MGNRGGKAKEPPALVLGCSEKVSVRAKRASDISARVLSECRSQLLQLSRQRPPLQESAPVPGVNTRVPPYGVPGKQLHQQGLAMAVAHLLGNPDFTTTKLFGGPQLVVPEVVAELAELGLIRRGIRPGTCPWLCPGQSGRKTYPVEQELIAPAQDGHSLRRGHQVVDACRRYERKVNLWAFLKQNASLHVRSYRCGLEEAEKWGAECLEPTRVFDIGSRVINHHHEVGVRPLIGWHIHTRLRPDQENGTNTGLAFSPAGHTLHKSIIRAHRSTIAGPCAMGNGNERPACAGTCAFARCTWCLTAS